MGAFHFNAVEKELATALARAGAEFLVVGGHATQFHGFLRATRDFDIFIRPNPENAAVVCAVLAGLQVNVTPEIQTALGRPKVKLPLRFPLDGIEILTSLSGVTPEEVLHQPAFGFIDGERVPVISLQHHVKNKLARGEPKDLQDVEGLKNAVPSNSSSSGRESA